MIFNKKRISLMMILLSSLFQGSYGMFNVEYKKAAQLTEQQLETVKHAWVTVTADV